MIYQEDFIPTPFLKRIFDVCGAVLAILVLFPFLVIFFIALMAERIISSAARGPFFYCEERISGGRSFCLCKIRVCLQAAIDEALRRHGFVHTTKLESQRQNFLPVGWWLKKFYLDEAPQLWNVLKGEMSLVGPRPANLENYQKLIKQGIYTKKAMRAGLTGYFQSYKGNNIRSDMEMDTEYIEFCRAHSAWQILWQDLKIIWRTIIVVLKHKGV